MGCGISTIRVSDMVLDRYRYIWDEELKLNEEQTSEILKGFYTLFGHKDTVIFKEQFCQTFLEHSIADYKRIDIDRLYVFATQVRLSR